MFHFGNFNFCSFSSLNTSVSVLFSYLTNSFLFFVQFKQFKFCSCSSLITSISIFPNQFNFCSVFHKQFIFCSLHSPVSASFVAFPGWRIMFCEESSPCIIFFAPRSWTMAQVFQCKSTRNTSLEAQRWLSIGAMKKRTGGCWSGLQGMKY